jgi:hypothetical protein
MRCRQSFGRKRSMTKSGDAGASFWRGFTCSASAFSPKIYGLDHNTAKKVASRSGAGISETGNTCRTVSRAILVLGLKYGTVTHIPAPPGHPC